MHSLQAFGILFVYAGITRAEVVLVVARHHRLHKMFSYLYGYCRHWVSCNFVSWFLLVVTISNN